VVDCVDKWAKSKAKIDKSLYLLEPFSQHIVKQCMAKCRNECYRPESL